MSVRMLTCDGVTLPIREWARRTGIERTTIVHRIKAGWTVEDALARPIRRANGLYRNQRPLYFTWKQMRARCQSPGNAKYPAYGARGIRVCDRWQDFETFAADMGVRPSPAHTLDRIDNDGNYGPENCRWATVKEQQRNRRDNHVLTALGHSRTISEWSELTGINQGTLWNRIHGGWDHARAVTTPARPLRIYTWRGRTTTLAEWARVLGVPRNTLANRIATGWSFDSAFGTPRSIAAGHHDSRTAVAS